LSPGPDALDVTPHHASDIAACAEAARTRALARGGVDWPAEEALRLRAETAARDLAVRERSLTFAMALRD
jgi:hypothetical protein